MRIDFNKTYENITKICMHEALRVPNLKYLILKKAHDKKIEKIKQKVNKSK